MSVDFQTVDQQHLQQLATWLDAPHVAPWFPVPQEFLDFALRPPVNGEQRIITVNGAPVGYLRWVILDRDTLDDAGFPGMPAGAADADLFIGNPALRGQGLGVAVLDWLCTSLSKAGTPLLALTTSVENTAAHSAFRKAGFRIHSRYTPESFGPCFLMIRELQTDIC